MRFMTLCTGAGGFDLGLESAGMECVGQCEIDRRCWPTLENRWRNVPRTEDVESDETAELVQRVRPDLIAFGFPCQDLSVAGRRAGLAGDRSGLFFRCTTLVSLCPPSWLVIENVPGLLSSNGGRDMGTVLGTLGQLGYRWAYRVLNAQYFGVPQRRRRVFIVAHLGDGADPAEVLFDAASMCGDSPESRETAADVARCLTSSPSGSRYDSDTENLVPVVFDPTQVTSRHNRSNLKPGNPCHTLPASVNAPVLIHRTGVRRLTPIECERLMGWPDNHTIGSDSARYRMCGNGVVAPVAEWIGRRIINSNPG